VSAEHAFPTKAVHRINQACFCLIPLATGKGEVTVNPPLSKACVAHALGARFLRRERTSTTGDSAGAINRLP
jgi:hypothetical protein